MWLIAVVNEKGGANKTTLVMNLAAAFAATAWRVLVVDVDPQKSATDWSKKVGEGLPFDFSSSTDPALLKNMRKLDYDIILVDTPGNLVVDGIFDAVLDSADFALVPVIPDPLCFRPTVKTVQKLIRRRTLPYRAVISNVDGRTRTRTGLADLEFVIEFLRAADIPHLQKFIRHYKKQARAPYEGTLVALSRRDRDSINAIDDLNQVALELISLLNREIGSPSQKQKKAKEA